MQKFIGISKRGLWRFFWPLFKIAFTKKNIKSRWKKTGLYPFDLLIILNILPKKGTQRIPLLPHNINSILFFTLIDTTAIQKLFNM